MELKQFDYYGRVFLELSSDKFHHGGPGWEHGTCLWTPADESCLSLVERIQIGNLIIHVQKRRHWASGDSKYHRIVGVSRVKATHEEVVEKKPPRTGGWDSAGSFLRIALEQFEEFDTNLTIFAFLSRCSEQINTKEIDSMVWTLMNQEEQGVLGAGSHLIECNQSFYQHMTVALGYYGAGSKKKLTDYVQTLTFAPRPNATWCFSIGTNAAALEQWIEQGALSFSWGLDTSLRDYPDAGQLYHYLYDTLQFNEDDGSAYQVYSFCWNIEVGDLIYIVSSSKTVEAMGQISSSYWYERSNSQLKHRRAVTWLARGPWQLDEELQSVVSRPNPRGPYTLDFFEIAKLHRKGI